MPKPTPEPAADPTVSTLVASVRFDLLVAMATQSDLAPYLTRDAGGMPAQEARC